MTVTRPGSKKVEDEIKESSEDSDIIAKETNALLQMAVDRLDVIVRILNKAYETDEEIEHVND